MHRHLIAVLTARRWTCRCGAVAEEPFGLCRKCRARAAWRRRHREARRNATRRPGGRTRDRARRLMRAVLQALTAAGDRPVGRPAPAALAACNSPHPPAQGPAVNGGDL